MGDQGAPVAPEQPVVLPAPVLPGWSLVPPPPSPPRHRRLLVPGIAVAVLLIVAALVMLWPGPPAPGGDEPGGEAIIGTGPSAHQSIGQIPGSGSTAGRGAASATSAPSVSSVSSVPGGTATVTLPGIATTVPGAGNGSLTVDARTGAGTIEITVSNVGGGAATWHSVALRLTGVNLGVSSADARITVTPFPGGYCAAPTAGPALLAAGAATTFTLSVLGLLSGVQSVGLDEPPC